MKVKTAERGELSCRLDEEFEVHLNFVAGNGASLASKAARHLPARVLHVFAQ